MGEEDSEVVGPIGECLSRETRRGFPLINILYLISVEVETWHKLTAPRVGIRPANESRELVEGN